MQNFNADVVKIYACAVLCSVFVMSNAAESFFTNFTLTDAKNDKTFEEIDMNASSKEGDLLLTPEQRAEFFAEEPRNSTMRTKRSTLKTIRLWPNGTVPIWLQPGQFSRKDIHSIIEAMTEWERYTCVRFNHPTRYDRNILRIINGKGCSSNLGMIGGQQNLILNPVCRVRGTILHELGHALGLIHVHQRPDRDNYVTIDWSNTLPAYSTQFLKYRFADMIVPYDVGSVMHYGFKGFSRNQKETIVPKDDKVRQGLTRALIRGLAYTDVQAVNKMYRCSFHCTNQGKCGSNGHLDQNCNCICKDGSSDCDQTKSATKTNQYKNQFDSWKCYIMANQGKCESNKLHMDRFCNKACSDVRDNNNGVCKDVYKPLLCSGWKSRQQCASNTAWMKKNCKSTCNMCSNRPTPETNCMNIHPAEWKCEKWAKAGQCFVYPPFMFKYCQRSCRLCNIKIPIPRNVDLKLTNIENAPVQCKDWAQDCNRRYLEGQCRTQTEYMFHACPKTCGICYSVPSFDTNDRCWFWATRGECEKNPIYMNPNCKASCTKWQRTNKDACENKAKDKLCEAFAKKMECIDPNTSQWMSHFCAKSCGTGSCATTTIKV